MLKCLYNERFSAIWLQGLDKLYPCVHNVYMDTKGYIHIRSRKETQRKLKIIAALKGESMLDTLDRLVSAEYDRVQKEGGKDACLEKDQD